MRNRGVNKDYGRRKPEKQPRRTVYVICEGGKTEYLYLNAIRKERRLRTIRIDIDPGTKSGSNPRSLLEHARARKASEDYDDVWCVFDDDGRDCVDQVLADAKSKPPVDVAFSNPCFELWYFLHYDYSTGACTQDQMVNKLKRYIPCYTKSANVFDVLPDRSAAMTRAVDIRKHHEQSGNKVTENPSTNVDELVRLLYSLEDPR